MKKIDVAGGPAQTLCEIGDSNGNGGAWNRDGVIIFAAAFAGPLRHVPAAGGQPEPITMLDESRGERRHSFPYFLPDGEHFLFLASSAATDNNAIFAGSLRSKEVKFVTRANSRVAYDRSGYMLLRASDR